MPLNNLMSSSRNETQDVACAANAEKKESAIGRRALGEWLSVEFIEKDAWHVAERPQAQRRWRDGAEAAQSTGVKGTKPFAAEHG